MSDLIVPIKSDWESSDILVEALKHGLEDLPTTVKEQIRFETQSQNPPLGTLHLETEIVVAVISSAIALTSTVINYVAHIISSRYSRKNLSMEISLANGASINIPVTATEEEIEKLFGVARKLSEIKEIQLIEKQEIDEES